MKEGLACAAAGAAAQAKPDHAMQTMAGSILRKMREVVMADRGDRKGCGLQASREQNFCEQQVCERHGADTAHGYRNRVSTKGNLQSPRPCLHAARIRGARHA